MNIAEFCKAFEVTIPRTVREQPTRRYALRLRIKKLHIEYYLFDPLRDIDGMISVKKQRLLNLAYAHVAPNEAYLEVGTWLGKSLLAAMQHNIPRPTFACDDFSEYDYTRGRQVDLETVFRRNLKRHGMDSSATFYNAPFREILNKERIPIPVGAYFYDAAHDKESQHRAIQLVEPCLADEALVIIDDWRFAPDSQSYAKIGTESAIAESRHQWRLLYELPARFNGDRAMWWNGVAVFAFQRTVKL